MAESLEHLARVQLGPIELDVARGVAHRPDGPRCLSKMELRVLRFLLRHGQETISREQLLVEVWGYSPLARTRAVDATVSRLRAKIEADPSTPEFLKTVYGVGYTLELPAIPEAPPAPTAPELVGREALLTRAESLIESSLLVTLTGPPGVGKSAVLRALAGRLRRPCELVALEGVSAPWPMLYQALSCPTTTPSGIDAALRQRPQLLLLLDLGAQALCSLREHLLRWSTFCAGVVVASRGPLGLPGESVLVVEPLSDEEGATLLEDHLWRSVRRRLPQDTRATLEALSSRLDGLPAALELAAPRLQTLPPANLIELLDQGGLGVIDKRQPGFRDAFRELHATLDDTERFYLCIISAFPVGLRCLSLSEVLSEDGAPEMLQVLERLVQRGLVQIHRDRIVTLRSVRDELCMLDPESARRAREQALGWMAKLARGLATPPHLAPRMQRLRDEWGNLNHLWAYAIDQDDPRGVALAEAILIVHISTGSHLEGERVFSTTRASLLLEPEQLAALCLSRGRLLLHVGEQELAYDALLEAFNTPEASPDTRTLAAAAMGAICSSGHRHSETLDWLLLPPDPASTAWVRAVAGRVKALGYVRLGRFDDARTALVAARRVFARIQDTINERHCLFRLSWTSAEQGRLAEAKHYLSRARELPCDNQNQIEGHELAMGVVLHDAGDLEAAEALLRDAAERIYREQRVRPEFISNLGWVLVEAGKHDEAEELLLRSIDAYERLANHANVAIATLNLAALRHQQRRELDALELLSSLSERADDELPRLYRSYMASQQAALLADLGRTAEACDALEQARSTGERGGRVLRRVMAIRAVHVTLSISPERKRAEHWRQAAADLQRLDQEAPVRSSDARMARVTLERAAGSLYELDTSI